MNTVNNERVNPFAGMSDDALDDFQPKDKSQQPTTPSPQQIDQLSKDVGFPSRQPSQDEKPKGEVGRRGRRYTTGRNVQLNVKVTQDALDRFYDLCDEMPGIPQGEILDRAVILLKAKNAEEGKGG